MGIHGWKSIDTEKKTKPELTSLFDILRWYAEQEDISSSRASTVSWVNPDRCCVDRWHANPSRKPLERVGTQTLVPLCYQDWPPRPQTSTTENLTDDTLALSTAAFLNYLLQTFSFHTPLSHLDPPSLWHYGSSFFLLTFLSYFIFSSFSPSSSSSS